MTDDVLTPPLPPAELSAEDAEVFERVWRRVMEGREAEPRLPAAVEQDALPPVGQTDGLLEQLRLRTALWRSTQSLARRAAGSMARVLNGMAAEERRQLARLAAVWYIATGQRWRPREGNAPAVPDLMEGLRQKYLHLQNAARTMQQPGEECFGDLYAELAARDAENAKIILRLLEQMQM